jgi:hypothetical protein
VREFLQDRAGKASLVAEHKRLIQAKGDIGGIKETPAAEANYFYRYLPQHLDDAGDRATLDALLLDPQWLVAKLEATRSPLALVSDYEQYGQGQMQNFIGQTLRLTAGICARDQRQLLPQLVGRLMRCVDPAAPAFIRAAKHQIRAPSIVTRHLSLTPPGAETARLAGHTDWITALAVLPDGHLASGSNDTTIRLWDPNSGGESGRLEGHTSGVTALAVLPDGHLASGSNDTTIRLWDPNSGSESRLEGHTDWITALAVLLRQHDPAMGPKECQRNRPTGGGRRCVLRRLA